MEVFPCAEETTGPEEGGGNRRELTSRKQTRRHSFALPRYTEHVPASTHSHALTHVAHVCSRDELLRMHHTHKMATKTSGRELSL